MPCVNLQGQAPAKPLRLDSATLLIQQELWARENRHEVEAHASITSSESLAQREITAVGTAWRDR